MRLTSLNHVARPTRQLDASRRFYREVLGAEEIPRPPFSFRGAWLQVAGIQIHLIEESGAPEPKPEISTRTHHIAFAVDSLEAMERHLDALGVPFRRNTIPGSNIPQLFFHDPDGHVIEVGGPYD